MKLKLGISIYSVPKSSIRTLIEFTERNNFNAIELWDSPLPNSNKWLSRYLGAGDRDLSVHAPLLDLGDKDTYEENILTLRKFFEKAGQWGAKTIVLHTGSIKNGRTIEGIETAKKVINSNLDLLEKNGLMLCIENVGYLGDDLIRDFEQLATFVDSFPMHLVGVVLDVSHANIAGGVSSGIDILGHRIRHLHLSDNKGDKNNHHMPLGKGHIDFRALDNVPISSTAILEITPDEQWEKNLLDSRRFLQSLGIASQIPDVKG